MTDFPLITVIVPVYNVEQHLRKCLDSICNQTYSNLEILCINDGSTDGSAAILAEYAACDSRIRIFTQANSGLGAARNVGLDHAKGEWIAGVDSDDYIEPDTFEYCRTGMVDEADVIYYGYESIFPDKGHIRPQDWEVTMKGLYQPSSTLLLNTPVMFWAKLWRRSFIENNSVRFPQRLWYEDLLVYWQLIPLAKGIYYLPNRKYKYVCRTNSIIGQTLKKSEKVFDHLIVLRKLLKWRKTHKLSPQLEVLDFYNTLYCHQLSMEYGPEELLGRVKNDFLHLINHYGLIKKWPLLRWYVGPITGISRLFVSRKRNKIIFSFLGIPFLSYNLRQFEMIKRILGIKVKKYPLL